MKFLDKNYNLKFPIWQSNNFVVFAEFFQDLKAEADYFNVDETPFSAKIREEKHLLYNDEKILAPKKVIKKDLLGLLFNNTLSIITKSEK